MSKKRVFVDGMETISFVEGMVRMDMFNFISGGQQREITEELIMTPQSFLRAYAAMEKLVKQFADAGMVTRQAVDDASGANSASPNFK